METSRVQIKCSVSKMCSSPRGENMQLYMKHSSPLFRDNNISTGCDGDQEPPLVHTKIFFNKHFHRHLVIHITLPAEHKNTPLNGRKLLKSVRHCLC